jgi:hypothetical protein
VCHFANYLASWPKLDRKPPKRLFEFFTVPIRNENTRAAYYHAVGHFLAGSQRAGFQSLEDIDPITI